jgi:hypothetical protein
VRSTEHGLPNPMAYDDPIERASDWLMAARLIPPVGHKREGHGTVVVLVRAEPDDALHDLRRRRDPCHTSCALSRPPTACWRGP